MLCVGCSLPVSQKSTGGVVASLLKPVRWQQNEENGSSQPSATEDIFYSSVGCRIVVVLSGIWLMQMGSVLSYYPKKIKKKAKVTIPHYSLWFGKKSLS